MIPFTKAFVARRHPYSQTRRPELHKESGDGAFSQGCPCSSAPVLLPVAFPLLLAWLPICDMGDTSLTSQLNITSTLPSPQPADL